MASRTEGSTWRKALHRPWLPDGPSTVSQATYLLRGSENRVGLDHTRRLQCANPPPVICPLFYNHIFAPVRSGSVPAFALFARANPGLSDILNRYSGVPCGRRVLPSTHYGPASVDRVSEFVSFRRGLWAQWMLRAARSDRPHAWAGAVSGSGERGRVNRSRMSGRNGGARKGRKRR